MFAQAKSITKAEHEAIEADRFKHRVAERLAAWEAILRERGIHIDPATGDVRLER